MLRPHSPGLLDYETFRPTTAVDQQTYQTMSTVISMNIFN